MSIVLATIASEGPSWPQIVGVLVAVWLVFGWAVWAHRPAAVPGRHRPDQVAVPDVFDRVMAAARDERAFRAFHANCRSFVELAEQARVPAHLLAVDDWTADLPTTQLPVFAGFDLADLYDSAMPAPARRFSPGGMVTEPAQRRTSPAERARERWGVDCPVFAQIADQWGYELGGEFTRAAA